MVVTDRKEGMLETIPNKEAFSLNQIFYDKVDEYWSPDFGGNYNIIEPTESLEHAVDKLKSNRIETGIVFLIFEVNHKEKQVCWMNCSY